RSSDHLAATSSAAIPWETSPGAYRSVTEGPYGSRPIRADPIGTRLIDSTPPAMTTTQAPESTPWAGECRACWLDPHRRTMVVAVTGCGGPAATMAIRA